VVAGVGACTWSALIAAWMDLVGAGAAPRQRLLQQGQARRDLGAIPERAVLGL